MRKIQGHTMNRNDDVKFAEEELLKKAYYFFNKRDIKGVLSLMQKDVDWPNGMEGGIEHGHDSVRNYWSRQWKMINPHVEPLQFKKLDDNKVNVTVHQVVKDLEGNILQDKIIHHIYTFENGFIKNMEIKE